MKIALYVRYLEDSSREQVARLAEQLHAAGVETEEISDILPATGYDFLFSIGGDGTLLSSVHLLAQRNIPIVGINFGHLGFLTTAGRDHLDTLVDDLLSGRYTLEPRTLLHVSYGSGDSRRDTFALNEVTLHRLDDGTLLHTDFYVDDAHVATYNGDGLIIATPTGSTAYSLSCGGPILTPDCGCFVVTPVSPHSLTFRPVIVPDSARLRLVTQPREAQFSLSADSRRIHLSCGTEVRLCRESHTVRLVRLYGQTFFSAIHQKLGWGTSAC